MISRELLEILACPKCKGPVELSADKYCSASIMLGKSAQITHDFEILDAAAAAPESAAAVKA